MFFKLTALMIGLFFIFVSYTFSLYSKQEKEDFYTTVCAFKSYVLNIIQLNDLSKVFMKFKEVVAELGITYFAISGTLIGTIRNKGFLAWDDDIDLGILINDVNKVHSYQDNLFYFETIFFGYKFKMKGSDMFIDIMVFSENEGVYRMVNNAFPNEYFYRHELFPLHVETFSGVDINVPNNFKAYLDRAYNEWDTKIKFECSHFGGDCSHQLMGLNSSLILR